MDVAPQPESPPPYTLLNWESGFTYSSPFGNGVAVQLNQSSGIMTITPNSLGLFLTGVEVKEYRNGVLLNKQTKVFVFRVVNCNVVQPLTITSSNSGEITEDCGDLFINFKRGDSTSAIMMSVKKSGTATENIDYSFPDSIYFPMNTSSITIPLIHWLDNVDENNETIILQVLVNNLCSNGIDTFSIQLVLKDYKLMILKYEDGLNICDQTESSILLSCNIKNGAEPYNYDWNFSNINNDTISIIPQQYLTVGINTIDFLIKDACNKKINGSIEIYNECPIIIPNVITINDDGINDFFIIRNLEYFEKSELLILNRWGEIVYSNCA